MHEKIAEFLFKVKFSFLNSIGIKNLIEFKLQIFATLINSERNENNFMLLEIEINVYL